MLNNIEFTSVKSDVNGNQRYVCHFLTLDVYGSGAGLDLSARYVLACKLANNIGGKKFHNKSYGGGIVFSSYSLDDLVKTINKVTKKNYSGYDR